MWGAFFFISGLLESPAIAAGLAEGVAQFALCESFAEALCEFALEDFAERLGMDVAKFNVSGVIQTAGDYASVVEDRDLRFEGMASAAGAWNAYVGHGQCRPFEARVHVQVEPPGNVEALVPAAEMRRCDRGTERFVHAGEECLVPVGTALRTGIPKPKVDVEFRPRGKR